MTRIAILDDYQRTALDCADWDSIPGDPHIATFNAPFAGEDAAAAALADFDVLVAMRERTPFPASLIARLPKLALLVTTGMRNGAFDMAAAAARGVPVCGTALLPYAAFEHAWALILALVKHIPRDDRPARLRRLAENYRFFGAPAGLFCFVDRVMGPPQWSDLGMFLQTFMLLATEAALSSCPQESWAYWSRTVAEFVQAPPELRLFCGMAIGYKDPDAPVNRLRSDREPLEVWATFV